jgi:16S rRNA processing protein RimM
MAPENRLLAPGGHPSPDPQRPDPDRPACARTLVRLGRLTGAHGLRGALRFRLDSTDCDWIKTLRRVFVESAEATREYRVLGCSPLGRNMMRLMLEGVDDASRADALKGAVVMAAEEEMPPPGDNEFYYYQAVGCEVALADGQVIGKIEEVFFNGANDVWLVRQDGREILIPVIADVVRAMDFAARRVTIEALPGLLD